MSARPISRFVAVPSSFGTAARPSARVAAQEHMADGESLGDSRKGILIASTVGLSEHGCTLKISPGALRLGQFVQIMFAGAGHVRAIVRYEGSGKAGVEFTRWVASGLIEAQRKSRQAVMITVL